MTASASSFTITVEPSGTAFSANPDETLLAAGIRQGVGLPYGCKDGACGSCKCKMVSGRVVQANFQRKALSVEEEAANFVLTCCATAQSDIVLESRQVTPAGALPIGLHGASACVIEAAAELERALDQLQQKRGGADFEVIALNMDTRNVDRVPKWLAENKINTLARYFDPAGKAFQTLRGIGKVQGLPTTFLIDRQGCLLAEMAGPANWASDEALAGRDHALKLPK